MYNETEREWRFRLSHMANAIREIQFYAIHETEEDFANDRKAVRSVERCFEILGEAARKIPKQIQNIYPQIPWRRITGLRNILAHDYDETSAFILWATIKRDLPSLEEDLNRVITILESEERK